MRTTRLIAAAATIAAMAFTATAAQAASFSPSNTGITITGTVTWEKAGSAPITCTLKLVRTVGWTYANQSPSCNGKVMQSDAYWVFPQIDAQGNDQIQLYASTSWAHPTPFPGVTMLAERFTVPFIDGNATTPSTMVLNDTIAGNINSGGYGPITWTGTPTVTQTANGGLVTIVP